MQNFIKTIINGVQNWTKKEIKKSTADWNQNDSSAADYVKNRTHYIEDGVVIFPETVIENYAYINFPSNLLIDEVYTINFNGEIYEQKMFGDSNSRYGFGNEKVKYEIFDFLPEGVNDTGELFFLELNDFLTGGTIFLTEDIHGTTNKISIVGPVKKRLDHNYLPDNIFTLNGAFSMNREANTAIGDYSHAEGKGTTASSNCSHAEGNSTTASGDYSHAEGRSTTASGSVSHAEGLGTIASSWYSHAEGRNTTASGGESHAEGRGTTASSDCSHAEGSGTTASGDYSHAEGLGTIAQRQCQHVQGEYNILDTEGVGGAKRGKYAHIVGNGTHQDERSNAHTIDWEGNAWYAGDVYVGSTSGTNRDDGSKKLATIDDVMSCIPEASVTNISDQVENFYFNFSAVESGLYWSDEMINNDSGVTAMGLFSVIKLTDTMANVWCVNGGFLWLMNNGIITSAKTVLRDTDTYYSLKTTDQTILGAINELHTNLSSCATEEYVDSAIANMDIPEVDGVIKYNETQELTDDEKFLAKKNTGYIDYNWRYLKSTAGQNKYLADYHIYGYDFFTNFDEAITVSSGVLNNYTAIGCFNYCACSMIQQYAADCDESIIPTWFNRLITDYNRLLEAGVLTLDANAIGICEKDTYSDNVALSYVFDANFRSDYPYMINYIVGYNGIIGNIMFNPDTGAVLNNLQLPQCDSTLSKSLKYANAKAVGDALANKIEVPATAQIGQTIAVKTVDENGKPTEWETIALPSIDGLATEEYVNNLIENSSSGGGSMLVTFTDGTDGKLIADKTIAEILEAHENGVCVNGLYMNALFTLDSVGNNKPLFDCTPGFWNGATCFVRAHRSILMSDDSNIYYNQKVIQDVPSDSQINQLIDAKLEALEETIPVPNTAQVGQTIVVKSVDENGKPTEWETIALPSIDGLATEEYVDTSIANLVDSAPETLNTLNELATAIQENDNVIDTLNAAITNKITVPQNAAAGDLLTYDGTSWVRISRADLITEIIAALPRAEEASF